MRMDVETKEEALATDLHRAESEIYAWKQEVKKLKEQVDYWRNKCLTNQSTMGLVETVALGEKLKCGKCNNYHPCRCDDGQ